MTELETLKNGKLTKEKISPISPIPGDVKFKIAYSDSAKAMLNANPLAIKRSRTWHGLTMFDAISNQCNAIGLYLSNIPGTDTILINSLQQSGETPKSFNTDGTASEDEDYKIRSSGSDANVISCSCRQDLSKFYPFVRLIGQCDSDFDPTWDSDKGEWTSSAKIRLKLEQLLPTEDSYLNKMLVKTINTVNTNAWLKEGDRVLNNVMVNQFRDLRRLTYIVPGHSQDGKAPYHVNHLADVQDDTLSAKDHLDMKMLVYGVTFTGSKTEGQRTSLEVCPVGLQ